MILSIIFTLRWSARHGKCVGNTMWTSLWSSAISKTWNTDIYCYFFSHHCLYPFLNLVDLLGKNTHFHRTRSFDFTWSRNFCHLVYTCSLWICNPSTTYKVFPNAKHYLSHAYKLLHYNLFPHTCMLGASVQVCITESWSCIGYGPFNVVKRDYPRLVYEVLSRLCKNPRPIVKGGVSGKQRIFSLCHTFCCHDLVKFWFWMFYVIFKLWPSNILCLWSLIIWHCSFVTAVLSGGHLNLSFCHQAFCQIHSLKLQCFLSGMFLYHPPGRTQNWSIFKRQVGLNVFHFMFTASIFL